MACDLWVVAVLEEDACVDLWLDVAGVLFTTVDEDLRVAAVLLCEAEGVDALLFCTVAVVALRVVLLALAAWLVADDLVFTEGELLLWLSCVAAGLASLLRVPCVLA